MLDNNTPLMITTLVNSGATGQFIGIKYFQSKSLQVQHLPRGILVYNANRTLNEAGHIMEAVKLIVPIRTTVRDTPSVSWVLAEPWSSWDTCGLWSTTQR